MEEPKEEVVATEDEPKTLVQNRGERINEEIKKISTEIGGTFTIIALLSLAFLLFSSGFLTLFSNFFFGLFLMLSSITFSGLSLGVHFGDKELKRRRGELETDEYLMISSVSETDKYKLLEGKEGNKNE